LKSLVFIFKTTVRAIRGEQQAVLVLSQDLVKVQQGGRLQDNGRADQAGRSDKQSAPAGDEAIR
jgi:hypothetical protein